MGHRIRHRAERHNDIIVDGELHLFSLSFALQNERRRPLRVLDALEMDVGHNGFCNEADALVVEPFRKRPHHRVILIIVGSHDALKAIEPLHHVHEAHEVALHLDGAVPGLERESRRPHRPEIRLEESLVEVVLDGARPEHVFRAEGQADKTKAVPFRQSERGRIELVAITDEARMRVCFEGLVTGENLLRDGPGAIEGGNRGKKVVGTDVMGLEHTAAAGDVAALGRTGPFKAAARLRLVAEYGDVPACDFTVADQEDRRGERGYSSADKMETGLLGDWII